MTHARYCRRGYPRRRLVVEPLEHRLQPSAGFSGLPDLAEFSHPATVTGPLPLTIVDGPAFSGLAAVGPARTGIATPALPEPVVGGTPRHDLYLVAFDVPDRDVLVRDLVAQPGFSGEVVELVGVGLTEVTAVLAGRTGLDAVHLLTHGAAGTITLGSDALDVTTLPRYSTDLKSWGAALSPGGDLLLYGCDVASDGGAFATRLAKLTGADVAATTDPTGARELGGDWVFEYSTGPIESIARSVAGWSHTLPSGLAPVVLAGNNDLVVPNRPPVTMADGYTTDEDTTLAGALGNDSDPDGDTLSAALATGAAHGTVTLDADGSFTYTPAANYAGPDSFTYAVSDGRGGTATGTVNLTVLPVNDTPAAGDDNYTTAVNLIVLSLPLAVSAPGVLGNDADADGDPLTAQLVSNPAGGLLSFNPNGSFTYTAVLNFSGTDAFSYRVTDGTAWSPPATVFINVSSPNRPPVAQADGYSTAEDTPLTVAATGVLGNDADPDGDSLYSILDSLPTNGTLRYTPNGGFTYTPALDWAGTDMFTYHATDGSRDSAPVTVTITVTPVNDLPTLDLLADVSVTEDAGPITIALTGISAGGGEAQPMTVVAVSNNPGVVPHPAVSYVSPAAVGTLTVTPTADPSGTATITVTVSDGTTMVTRTFTVTVTRVNDAPDAADDDFVTPQNTPITVAAGGVLDNDSDADGDTLAAVLIAGPTNGTLTFNADGSFTYAPDQGFCGTDRFTYQASDGSAVSRLAAVDLRVLPPPARPVASDDAYTVVGDQVLTVPPPGVLANDTRSGSGTLTAVHVSGPRHGTLALNADGSFTYTPAVGYVGLDSFNYKAADGGGETGVAHVAIQVRRPNRVPAGTADVVATVAGTPVTLTAAAVLANDSDPDGDAMTAELVAGAANGTVTMSADGSFTYTPNDGFRGTDTFTYEVTDGELVSGLIQVTVSVTDPPPPSDPSPTPAEPTVSDPPPATGAAPPTTTAAPTVSFAPSASGSFDGSSPIGAGPLGTVRPTPTASSGGVSPSSPRDTPAAIDAGRVYPIGEAPAVAAPLAPEVAPPPAPAAAAAVPPAQPTSVVVLPSAPPPSLPPIAPAVTTPPTIVVLPDSVLAPLDRMRDDLRAEAAERATTDTIVVTGGVAVAGTVLLNTRAVYWFLSALLARPAVWRRFDPLDVVYAWDRENARPRGTGPDDSLQSMVG